MNRRGRKLSDLSDEQRAILMLTRDVNSNNVREDRDRRTDRLLKKLREDWRRTHSQSQVIVPRAIRHPEFRRGVRIERS